MEKFVYEAPEMEVVELKSVGFLCNSGEGSEAPDEGEGF